MYIVTTTITAVTRFIHDDLYWPETMQRQELKRDRIQQLHCEAQSMTLFHPGGKNHSIENQRMR